MAKLKDGISLVENHDYLMIKTANWAFTMSYGGEKVSGTILKAEGVFEKMCQFVADFKKTPGTTNGDAMRALATKGALDKIWLEWSTATAPEIAVGDIVKIPDFPKKYPGEYEVVEVKRAYAYLRLSDKETCGFHRQMLVVVGKKQPVV